MECQCRGCEGVSLVHWNVSRPQSGEGRKRDLWHGQPYHIGAHGSLLLEISCSAPLPLLSGYLFLSYPLFCLAQFWFLSILAPVLQGSPGWSFFWVQRLDCSSPFTSYCGQLALTLYSLFDWTKPRTASGVLVGLQYLQRGTYWLF